MFRSSRKPRNRNDKTPYNSKDKRVDMTYEQMRILQKSLYVFGYSWLDITMMSREEKISIYKKEMVRWKLK